MLRDAYSNAVKPTSSATPLGINHLIPLPSLHPQRPLRAGGDPGAPLTSSSLSASSGTPRLCSVTAPTSSRRRCHPTYLLSWRCRRCQGPAAAAPALVLPLGIVGDAGAAATSAPASSSLSAYSGALRPRCSDRAAPASSSLSASSGTSGSRRPQRRRRHTAAAPSLSPHPPTGRPWQPGAKLGSRPSSSARPRSHRVLRKGDTTRARPQRGHGINDDTSRGIVSLPALLTTT